MISQPFTVKGRTTPSLTPQVLHFIRECVPKSTKFWSLHNTVGSKYV